MNNVEQAVSCFKQGFYCSQAVLSAYSQKFGLDRETALKITGAFGGGICHMGREFVNRFEARNGSIMCKELLGCDISTPEGMKIIEDKKLFETLCPKLVQDAAEIIEQIL